MNKLTKLLSVFVIAGAVGAGVAGIAACKTTPDEPTHTHTAAATWETDANKHWHKCTADDGAKLDEGNHVYDNDQDATCNTCEYTRSVASTDADIPEGAIGLKVTLAHEEVELNADTKSTTVSADDLELQYINENQEVISGSTVDKSKCTITIMHGNATLALGDQLTKGEYVIMVLRNNNVFGSATLTVKDPVKAGSLALKAGANTSQEQGEDTISSSLKWEVELASGVKEEVKKVTVTGIDTYSVGADKTATAELEMDGKTLIKEFKYTVTDKTGYAVQSAIINVNKLTPASAVETNTDLGSGVVLTAKSGKPVNIDGSSKQADGKAFTQRLKLEGSPIKNNALDGTTIFRTLQFADLNAPVTGATVKTKITIYASASDTRKIALYKQSGTNGTDAALTVVGDPVEVKKELAKIEFTITEAGTFHIASTSGGCYVHYIRVDKIIEGGTAEDQPINAAAGQTLASIEKDVPEEVQTFTVGDTFSSAGIQVLGVYANDVTCDVTKKDLSADATLEYSGYDMTKVGEQTVTISYSGKTTTYDITVESKVAGVYGVEATLKTSFNPQIAESSSDTSITIRKGDIEAKIKGENANATISYTVKKGDTEINDTDGLALAKGKHTLTVEITVSDGTNTYTETKTIEVTITKEGEASPVNLVSSNLTAGAKLGEDTVVADETLAKITLLKECTVEANDATAPYTNRIKTGGGATAAKKAIKVEVTAPAKITVLYKKGGSSSRQLAIYSDASGSFTALKTAAEADDTATLFTFEYDITAAGTYYLGGNNGINIYEITIEPA